MGFFFLAGFLASTLTAGVPVSLTARTSAGAADFAGASVATAVTGTAANAAVASINNSLLIIGTELQVGNVYGIITFD